MVSPLLCKLCKCGCGLVVKHRICDPFITQNFLDGFCTLLIFFAAANTSGQGGLVVAALRASEVAQVGDRVFCDVR